ncbi:hypothetical protein RRF57_012675 [Xylaria bambusicola]|uniref:Uncharacterized protein n=1 Tax=Xylaria bambusicola TaxID=326684 RepID=A0AAN7UZU7_9PEZI
MAWFRLGHVVGHSIASWLQGIHPNEADTVFTLVGTRLLPEHLSNHEGSSLSLVGHDGTPSRSKE